jgi:tetratricopeptide (TPR) repeat protein
MAEKSLPEDNPKLILFFDAEAYFLCQTGKYREAEKKWMTALKIAERAYGENEVHYGGLLLHLGQMYSVLGDYPAAETMLQRSLAAKEKINGSDPIDRAIIMSTLGDVYVKHRKLTEAEPLILNSAEASNAGCGDAPIACAFIRSNLGGYYMTKRQWGMAETEFERALKLREVALGEHPLVADSLTSMSRALRKLNRKKEAKSSEARAAKIVSSQRSPLYEAGNTIDVRAFQANNR